MWIALVEETNVAKFEWYRAQFQKIEKSRMRIIIFQKEILENKLQKKVITNL